MDHFTTRPGAWQLTTRAWGSTRAAIGAMPLLFLSAMVLSIALSLASFAVPWVTNLVMVAPKSVTPAMVWPALGMRAVITVAWAILATPVAVAVHRFILLDQVTRGPVSWLPRHTLAFAAWLVAIRFLYVLVSGGMLLLRNAAAEIFVVYCGAFALAVIGVYLTMLFPAVAVETPSKSVSARLETSMQQMSGHFWLFVFAVFLTFIPAVVVTAVIQIALLRSITQSAIQGLATHAPVIALVGAGLLGVLQIVFVALAASVASWLYSWVSRDSSSGAASG